MPRPYERRQQSSDATDYLGYVYLYTQPARDTHSRALRSLSQGRKAATRADVPDKGRQASYDFPSHIVGKSRRNKMSSQAASRLVLVRQRRVAWQLLQVIWVASVLIAFPILLESRRAQFPGSHAEILSAAAAVGSVFAELFMIKSLLVFDPKTKFGSTGSQQPASPAYSRSAVNATPGPSSARVSWQGGCVV